MYKTKMEDLFSLSTKEFNQALADRQKYNKELLERIKLYVEMYPDWRFHQILQNIGICMRVQGDMFFEESYETARRVRETLGEMGIETETNN